MNIWETTLLVGIVVVVVARRLMGRSATGGDRRRRRRAVMLAVLVLMFCFARPFSSSVSWRREVGWVERSEPHQNNSGKVVGLAALDPPYALTGPTRPMPDRKRTKHPLLLAAAGVTRAITGNEPAMAARGAPLTPNPSPARGEGSFETASKPPAAASKRPAWIDAKPDRIGDAFQMAVSVGPYPTLVQCDNELPAAVRDAVQDYAETHLDHRARGIRLQLENLEVLPANVIAETYQETVSTSFGPMQQLYARLALDRRANEWVREQVRQALVAQRLWYVGGGAVGVLAGLAVLWAGLKSRIGAHGVA